MKKFSQPTTVPDRSAQRRDYLPNCKKVLTGISFSVLIFLMTGFFGSPGYAQDPPRDMSVSMQADFQDGILVGYNYKKASLDAITANDRIVITTKGGTNPMKDMRTVVVAAVEKKGDKLVFKLKEPVAMSETETVTSLTFVLKGDCYVLQ